MKLGRLVVTFLAIFVCLSMTGQAAAERHNPRGGRVTGVTAGPSAVPPGFSQVVIFAANSVDFAQDGVVESGAVVVNQAATGQTLGCGGRELCVGVRVTTPAGYAVKADSIQIKNGGLIQGSAFCNDLLNNGANPGLACGALSLPVFATLPTFVSAPPRPGAPSVSVPKNGSTTLAPGDYDLISVLQGGVVTFTGGIYNVAEIDAGPSSTLRFSAPSEIRIAGKFGLDHDAFVGPAVGSGITAADLVFYVAGINGNNGAFGATPRAVKIGTSGTAQASFYAPNGTLQMQQGAQATGAFLARDVQVGPDVHVTLASFFVNRAPKADPQTVSTSGAAPITITLTASDPEGDDLVFSIVTGPTQGSLGSVMQGPPPTPGDPPGCGTDPNPPCTTPPVPPRNSATVVYTPSTAGNVEDSFVFQVTDPSGNTGMATVSINPPGDPTPTPTPVGTVVARPVSAETTREHAVVVQLFADAPDGVSASFSLVVGGGPAHGALSAVTQGTESPQRTATVTYTPAAGYVGNDSFDFQACGTVSSVVVCSTATATLQVASGDAVADPQEVETPQDTSISITLTGTPGVDAGGSGLTVIVGRAAFLDGAEIAGNVADATGDGFGDNHNALPGPAPVLVAASVDGASPSPRTWTLDEVTFADGSTASGTFVFDAGTFAASDWNITTTAGPGFGATTYTPSNSTYSHYNSGNPQDTLQFQSNTEVGASGSNYRQLRLTPVVALTNSGGAVALDLATADGGSGGVECFNCSPFRLINGGSLSAPGASGAGSQGVARIQIEWDITGLHGLVDSLQSAQVILYTTKGTVDSLDTFFYAGTGDQDGLLTDSDFEAPASQLAGVVMPVPAVPAGTDGSFTFDVKDQLLLALTNDAIHFFSIQGRVDEGLAGTGFQRGLQVRSSATGNLSSHLEPELSLTTPGVTAPALTYSILALPAHGTLKDSSGTPITSVPTSLVSQQVTYIPNPGYSGPDNFTFQVDDGLTHSSALIALVVGSATCSGGIDPNGRPCS